MDQKDSYSSSDLLELNAKLSSTQKSLDETKIERDGLKEVIYTLNYIIYIS